MEFGGVDGYKNFHDPGLYMFAEQEFPPIYDTIIRPLFSVATEDHHYSTGEYTGETPGDDIYVGEYADHFNDQHAILKNDYTDVTGEAPVSCKRVALDMYKLIKTNGKTSRVMTLFGKSVDPDGDRAWLIPTAYEGRIQWASHVICVSAGIVYDPMLPRPLPMEDYLVTAFDQEVLVEDKLYL
jgi:hypothetical protein